MARLFAFLFILFMALVVVNFVWGALGNAFASYGSSPFGMGIGSIGPSGGLSQVELTSFNSGGSGLKYITQGYGNTPYAYMYVGHWHNGIDIAARYGAPIYSPSDGVVVATGNQDNFCYHRGFGEFVAVKDADAGVVLWYAHLGTIAVSPGQKIKKGDAIGNVGTTGLETGAHLHLSVFEANGFSMKPKNGCGPDADGKDINPLSYLAPLH